jgi:hypothetical protein
MAKVLSPGSLLFLERALPGHFQASKGGNRRDVTLGPGPALVLASIPASPSCLVPSHHVVTAGGVGWIRGSYGFVVPNQPAL